MGCDIHAMVYAQPKDGQWNPEPVLGFREPRWYALFGAMAGVRNPDLEFIEPRGLPAWATNNDTPYCPTCVRDFDADADWLFGDHTFSWLTTDEFESALGRAIQESNRSVAEYDGILAFMKALEASGQKAYIVFGFDS